MHAGQDLDQRRLAGAVVADEADRLAALDRQERLAGEQPRQQPQRSGSKSKRRPSGKKRR